MIILHSLQTILEKKYIKGSYAFQWARKLEILKKEIKVWKKASYNKEVNDIDTKKSKLASEQFLVMNNTFHIDGWQQVEHLKLERNFIEQEIHWAHRARQAWF